MFLDFLALMLRPMLAADVPISLTRDCRLRVGSASAAVSSAKSRAPSQWPVRRESAIANTPDLTQLRPRTSRCPSSVLLQHLESAWICSMAEITLGGILYVGMMFHSEGLWMLSKVLAKSFKLMASGVWNSLHFSMMRRRVDICSAQKRLGRNHACCSRNSLSTASRMRFRITWQYTFPGMDRSVTPVQLSHCVRLPFLGIQTTAPFLQSSGTSPEF